VVWWVWGIKVEVVNRAPAQEEEKNKKGRVGRGILSSGFGDRN